MERTKTKALIVGDSEQGRYLLESLLKDVDFHVVRAANGAEALEKLRAQGFDIVITDILMPVMDGFQLCMYVKQDERLRKIPLVFYSAACTDEHDEALAMAMGAHKFIRKPVGPGDFIRIINEVIAEVREGKIHPIEPFLEEHGVLFRRYNERVVKKLEQKMHELDQEIAECKKFEEALRESEERYRALFEGAAEGILAADVQTKKLSYANPAICKMFGYTTEEMTQLSIRDVHPTESVEKVIAEFEALARREKVIAPNIPCVRKDGSVFYADIAGRPIVIEKRMMNVGFFTDITERKKAEAELRESKERLQLALRGADLGLWDYNLQTGEAFISQRRAEMVGYAVDEIEPHISSWGKMVHLEDLQRVLEAFNAHAKGETPFYECEHRLRCKSGEYIWVLARAKIVERDATGSPVRLIGTSLDITERKKAEAALRESEERYRELVENSNDIVFRINTEGFFTFVNRAASRISGYSEEELIRLHFTDLILPEYREETQKFYGRQLVKKIPSRKLPGLIMITF